ncbi:inosine/guanosine kinase [Bacteriovoracaceae bacterium]|nr:inosine/guanosine kinase [Bacteriovoracaceae bacterium]
MKFPGKRKSKHYFPVSAENRQSLNSNYNSEHKVFIVGLDQLIVDIEVKVTNEYLKELGLKPGESVVIPDERMESIYKTVKDNNLVIGEFAGGAVGNTLHNYSVLADDASVALGSISKHINVGDYAFKYICTTNSHVDLSYLMPCEGAMARALCFVTEDGERTFAIGKGIMNDLDPEFIPHNVVANAGALLITTFLLRDKDSPMYQSTLKAVSIAKENDVPVVLSLGTGHLVSDMKEFLNDFIKENVTVVAMNENEAKHWLNEEDPLLAGKKALEYADLILLTVGASGLYICGYTDEECARETKDKMHSKSLPLYNQFEYSRAMRKMDCKKPIKIFTHINPFMGGPGRVENTNGAGDAALAALLHDISSNKYHKVIVPNSPKHNEKFLTYSSIHQISKYANRASFEVLSQNSPRLSRGLPEKEDSLEESYWEL